MVATCRWLVNEVTNFGVDQYDPYLWESIEGAFCQQFADTLEKERAQMQLHQGFKMKGGNIDEYVSKFDLLVIKLAIEQTTCRRWKSSSMDSQHHYTKQSTSWTTRRHTKDGGEQPSNDRRNGSICSPSNKDATSLNGFDPGRQNQTTWVDSLHLRIHPYPMQT